MKDRRIFTFRHCPAQIFIHIAIWLPGQSRGEDWLIMTVQKKLDFGCSVTAVGEKYI
jgi:hypothetical protein